MRITMRSFVHPVLNRMVHSPWGILLFVFLVLGFILSGCVQAPKGPPPESLPPAPFAGLMPVNPQPPEALVRPGVRVWFFDDFEFNHVAEMPRGEPPFSWGFAGKPVLIIDRDFAPQEKVWDSGMHRHLALQMNGMIKFPVPGEYGLRANSNDGIRVYIDKKRVINDAYWHGDGDRLTPISKLEISTPGWYPFKLKFFQREGTAALQLFWKKPGDADFSIIPAEAYGHISEPK